MRSEILEKLNRYTSSIPSEESHVVYFVVQVGKFIESEGTQSNFPTLWFYRNWIVHYQLDRRGNDGRQGMLDRLNKAVISINDDHEKFAQLLRDAVSLRRLHEEVKTFCETHSLARPECGYGEWFQAFDKLLLRILIDLPLITPQDADYLFTEFRFQIPTMRYEFELRIKFVENSVLGNAVEVTVPGDLKEFN